MLSTVDFKNAFEVPRLSCLIHHAIFQDLLDVYFPLCYHCCSTPRMMPYLIYYTDTANCDAFKNVLCLHS